jgi:hypothetical protein
MLVAAAPCALLWPAAMILWGPGFRASRHKHHCVQLLMALDGNLRIRRGPGEKWRICGAALVRTDTPHEVDATNLQFLLAFVDAESDLGASLLAKVSSPIHVVEDTEVQTWRNALGPPSALRFGPRKFMDMQVSPSGSADADAPSQGPANRVNVTRRTGNQAYRHFEAFGRNRGTVAITVHARVHAIRRRAPTAIGSLAPITTGLQRNDEWRNGNPSGPSRGLRRRCPLHPHGASYARHHSGRSRSPTSATKTAFADSLAP